MSSSKRKKWTIFFVVKSTDGSFKELITMVNEIRSIPYGGNISVFFCVTLIKDTLEKLRVGDYNYPTDGDEDFKTTVFLKLVHDNSVGARFPSKLEVLNEDPSIEITTVEGLKAFFKAYPPAADSRTILFTWDHGRAYGMFEEVEPKQFGKAVFNLTVHQQEEDRVLTMDELQRAIHEGFPKHRVELIVMMNCSMQCFDTLYALRNVADYLVTTETLVSFDGYNYPHIFQLLSHRPGVSVRSLARQVVTSYATKLFPSYGIEVEQKSVTTLFATDLRYCDTIAGQIDAVARFLMDRIRIDKLSILLAKRSNYIHRALEIIDFYSFLRQLYVLDYFSPEPIVAGLILSTRDLVVMKRYVGDAYSYESQLSTGLPSGFSIYFPSYIDPNSVKDSGFINSSSTAHRDEFLHTSFFKENAWGKFVTECDDL